jgi:hypothetical protein
MISVPVDSEPTWFFLLEAMTRAFNIAVIEGDGLGPEVTREA